MMKKADNCYCRESRQEIYLDRCDGNLLLPMDVLLEIGGSIAYYVACKLPGSNPDAVIASEILRLNQSCCFFIEFEPEDSTNA